MIQLWGVLNDDLDLAHGDYTVWVTSGAEDFMHPTYTITARSGGEFLWVL